MSLNDEYNLNLPKQKYMAVSASFSKRALSLLIALFICYFFMLSPLFALMPIKDNVIDGMNYLLYSNNSLLLILISASGLILLLYFSLFQYFLGRTPGMQLMNLYTLPMTFSQAVVRNLLFVPIFPFSLLWILDLIFLIWKKRRFLELVSNTLSIEIMEY
jgi:uncharacterized RDD family membrane protein YckC